MLLPAPGFHVPPEPYWQDRPGSHLAEKEGGVPSPHPASQSTHGRVESQARDHHFFSRFFRRLVSPAVRGLTVWGSRAQRRGQPAPQGAALCRELPSVSGQCVF